MKRKFLAIIIAIISVLMLLPFGCEVETEGEDVILISSAEQLSAWGLAVKEGVDFSEKTLKLKKDIDMQNVEWQPVDLQNGEGNNKGLIIDGNNHTIKNLKVRGFTLISSDKKYGCAFIGRAVEEIEIKNITFQNLDSSITGDSSSGNIVGGILGYSYGDTTFSHVNVKNSTVSGFGKVGVFLGLGATHGIMVKFISCISENNNINAYYNAGGLAGTVFRAESGDTVMVSGTVVRDNTFTGADQPESYIELDTTVKCSETTNPYCLGEGARVQGLYWNSPSYYGGSYAYGAYAVYYVSFGDSAHDDVLEGKDFLLADSELCINEIIP